MSINKAICFSPKGISRIAGFSLQNTIQILEALKERILSALNMTKSNYMAELNFTSNFTVQKFQQGRNGFCPYDDNATGEWKQKWDYI